MAYDPVIAAMEKYFQSQGTPSSVDLLKGALLDDLETMPVFITRDGRKTKVNPAPEHIEIYRENVASEFRRRMNSKTPEVVKPKEIRILCWHMATYTAAANGVYDVTDPSQVTDR